MLGNGHVGRERKHKPVAPASHHLTTSHHQPRTGAGVINMRPHAGVISGATDKPGAWAAHVVHDCTLTTWDGICGVMSHEL